MRRTTSWAPFSAKCEREGREIVLVTGDRDSFQLSGEKTTILYTKRGISGHRSRNARVYF